MQVDEMILVSIDDHVIEPPGIFERHMPARYKDRAPRIETAPGGGTRWIFQGIETGHMALGAVASWPKEEWDMDPAGYPEMRPGCYDIHERIRDMNANGVLASMAFPTFAGFSGTHLARGEDRELTQVTISAYNDWHIDEWAGTYPGRFMPLAIGTIWDVDALVAEIHRIGSKGCRAISLPETPHGLGLPSYYTDHWDPVFAALCDNDIAICMHIGQSYRLLQTAPEAPGDTQIMLSAPLAMVTLADLMVSGVFRRFPALRIALSEAGIGWLPHFLDKIDRQVRVQAWSGLQVGAPGKTPTEVFRENVLACFITDRTSLQLRARIGIDCIAWECDYPHSDSTWPSSPELLLAECDSAGLTDEEVHKISWENACRFFRFDPLSAVAREAANVRSLRALAGDVDTSTTSRHEYRRRYESTSG